jgi:hypothetical protein
MHREETTSRPVSQSHSSTQGHENLTSVAQSQIPNLLFPAQAFHSVIKWLESRSSLHPKADFLAHHGRQASKPLPFQPLNQDETLFSFL